MIKELMCYINGEWVKPQGTEMFDVINPATEELTSKLQLGNESDVDNAVKAAKEAFKTYSLSTREDRTSLLGNIIYQIEKRLDELARAITLEMGAPEWFAKEAQAASPVDILKNTLDVLKTYAFEQSYKISLVKKVPIGVCGFITPWNWPAYAVISKVAPALATGCTMILKPSVYSPFSAQVIAEALHDAGVPKGVFNMVYGSGEVVGRAITGHPDIDCISFTGSYRAGVDAAVNAAPTIKRVVQELGGKSPNIILPSIDADYIRRKVKEGIRSLMSNSGQSCNAPSRMLVPKSQYETVKSAILEEIPKIKAGVPNNGNKSAYIGPVANKVQYEHIQEYIQSGINEGATLVIGGTGKPEGLEKGYYVKPSVFTDTNPDMKIVKEEIFGPVLVVQAYDSVDEAIELANNTTYGLAAYVQGEDFDEVKKVADKILAGQVYLNDSGLELSDSNVPFGGVKFSGNGREQGKYGFAEFLELKALVGYYPEK